MHRGLPLLLLALLILTACGGATQRDAKVGPSAPLTAPEPPAGAKTVLAGSMDSVEGSPVALDSYLGKVLAAGMSKLQSGYPAAVEAMQAAENEQAMSLEHKISYVSLVGALAPMFGLLGTVDGMVAAFMLIAQRDTAPKPSELAVGISQALVTTLIGLWLAIPAIACYGLLKNWLQRFNKDVDDEAMRLMSRFQTMGKKTG